MQKCFINLKVEEDKKETITQRERCVHEAQKKYIILYCFVCLLEPAVEEKLELFCCINTAFVYLSEDSIDIRCTEFPDFSEEFRQIIKAGWLEKTPPKG